MSTSKRDRQRANREEKKTEEAKASKRQHQIGLVKKWAMYTAIFLVAIVGMRLIAG